MANLEEIFQVQKQYRIDNEDKGDTGYNGMVASAIKEASEAGNKMLDEGGNAFDALIAVQLALAVVEGMNTGIGAGGFILCYDNENKKTKVVTAHSRAPSGLTPDCFVEDDGEVMPFDERTESPVSIGVPGIMKGLEYLHKNYATLPLEQLIDPAIHLAKNEFRVNSLWDRTIQLFKHRLKETARQKFTPNGKPLREGDTITQLELAKTLEIIRDQGFKAVYEGEIADAIIDTVQEHGGMLTHQDLLNYHVKIDEPLWSTYRDFKLAFPYPPSGGGVAVAQQLKIFEELDISQYEPHSWEKYHLMAQTLQLALADREAHIGDPNFHRLPSDGLLHPDYIKKRANQIDLNKDVSKVEAGDPWEYQEGKDGSIQTNTYVDNEGYETTHFTAVDQWGNIASCTSSIERIFGSGIMVPHYGFLLNNDLTDFNPEPGNVNEPNSNKYPASSKCPTIMFHDDKPFFTLGSPGGPTIVASVAQTILNVIDYNMPLEKAIKEPRLYTTPDLETQWEDGINEKALQKLRSLGYEFTHSFRVVSADTRLGDVQAIMIDQTNGHFLYGVADSPRPGDAEGLE
ncbi:gamma-glutamyltransferase [Salinicoccus sp. HZC-1]|uniref:gamma-glutamyltransferase n=1 Tax=Salinicoccus sp. HZC-1 TaxID=3385497 RepID=UPI00398AE1E0